MVMLSGFAKRVRLIYNFILRKLSIILNLLTEEVILAEDRTTEEERMHIMNGKCD